MMKTSIWLVTAMAVLAGGVRADVATLTWGTLPALPPSAGQTRQPGVAGPFAGVHGGALLVAGGANFPEKLPWDGGAKVWWDDIWVLEDVAGAAPRWVTDRTFRLPRRIGYGVSVSTPDGVVCAGGHDAERCYADVFLLAWDAAARTVRRTELPRMPEPLSFMAGALVGDTLYVAGGQTAMKGAGAAPSRVFWALDLSKRKRGAEFAWEVLPAWPGPARVLPVAAAQRGAGGGEEFFLFSGRAPEPGRVTRLLSDAYAFDPKTRRWRVLPPVSDGERTGVCVMAGTAAAVGEREILLFGGDGGEMFRELEAHDLAIADLKKHAAEGAVAQGDVEAAIELRLEAKRKLYAAHPGFSRDVLAFDTRANAWRVAGRSPLPPQVTTVAVKIGEAIVIPSGEVKPGIRTAEIVRVRP